MSAFTDVPIRPGASPARASISELRARLSAGHSTVTEQVRLTLAAIEEANGRLGAFVAVAGDEALRQASAADQLIEKLGASAWEVQPLLGVTVGVKDLIQTRDLPTRRGSLLPNGRPRQDAPSVARLRAAGAIIVGKTATSEHGWSASTVSRLAGPARNPWAADRSAGGSSGGSAAAVAAGLCDIALGTDGAGSIRIPAAFCGVVGYKPTFGRVPYVPPCADRLAHAGPVTSCVADAAEVGAVLAGPHAADPDSDSGQPATGREQGEQGGQRGPKTIGWIEFPGTSPQVREVSERASAVLTAQGHRVERIEVPFDDPYRALVDVLSAAEAASLTAGDESGCDPGRLAIARHGRTVSGADVMRAEEIRMELRARLRSVMGRFDLLAMATVPIEPFAVDAIAPPWAADPADLLWLAWSPASYPFNLTGQPAISIPVGLTSAALPVGVQLVGPVGDDEELLAAASRLEADLIPRAFDPHQPVDPHLKGR